MKKITPIIISGGSGLRLWPKSRNTSPKQFINFNGKSLFELTLERINALEGFIIDEVIISCSKEHEWLVTEQLKSFRGNFKIILEPLSLDTAAAIALACRFLDDNANLLVLPSDHFLEDYDKFSKAVVRAFEMVEKGKIVSLGVIPDNPSSSYGYIKKGNKLSPETFEIAEFKEKPDQQTAEEFLRSKLYLWNSGIFAFKNSDFKNELNLYRSDIAHFCREAEIIEQSEPNKFTFAKETLVDCPKTSIDYAIMEKTNLGCSVVIDAPWSDLGSWDSFFEISEKDKDGNHLSGEIILKEVSSSYLESKDKLLVAIGVKDLIVVDTADAILVSAKSKEKQLKELINENLTNHIEFQQEKEVKRPWGSFISLINGNNYQVKKLTLLPDSQISLQRHKFRTEHWVIVSGVAEVTKNDEVLKLSRNDSIYIDKGDIHRLKNISEVSLVVIETQVGDYLGEDDIERFEDIYGRT